MKALVTGADGFIGSHLAEQLVKDGHEVRAFVYYNSFNSWGWVDSFPYEIKDKIDTGGMGGKNALTRQLARLRKISVVSMIVFSGKRTYYGSLYI